MLMTLNVKITQRLWMSDRTLVRGARGAIDATVMATPPFPPRASGRRGLFLLELRTERDDPRDEPALPHLVHLRLEVREVLLGEVREASLPEQVVLDRPALRPALGDVLRLPHEAQDSVLHLVERPDAGQHRELAQLVRLHGVVVPALRARIERVDEGRAADGERLAHGVHGWHG